MDQSASSIYGYSAAALKLLTVQQEAKMRNREARLNRAIILMHAKFDSRLFCDWCDIKPITKQHVSYLLPSFK